MISWVDLILMLVFAPLVLGIINRTKAIVAGRRGQPLLQCYYDIAKLIRKGAAISKTTTWIFSAGPAVSLACVIIVSMFIPFGKHAALLTFTGDIILLAYVLGLARFFTVISALDTGSSFEGMGASREVFFASLAEIAFFVVILTLVFMTDAFSLSSISSEISSNLWMKMGPPLVLVAVTLYILILAENGRIPVDDPNTHLELTMIHEVMVLDHGGINLAFITYGAALKIMIFSSLLVCLLVPVPQSIAWAGSFIHLVAIFIVAISIGLVESTMARIKLVSVPQLLVCAAGLSFVALVVAYIVR